MKHLRGLVSLILLGGTMLALGDAPADSPLSYYLNFPVLELPATHSVNPAWLRFELNERVVYRCDVITEGGRWHLPYEPREQTNVITRATGTRVLSPGHLFTGTFGYRYQLIEDKLWVHNQAPYNGNPFLFGDSTLGGFQLRGMFWEAGYSRELLGHWYNGIALFYNVDEEYKTVFPKSQVKHRDLELRMGTAYQLSSGSRCGLNLSYFDFQEILTTSQYTLEQNKSPIFIKIRATDNPLLAYGQTSEERLFAIQGYNLGLDGRWQSGRTLLTYQLNAEQAQAQNVDGGAYPVKQGRWYVERAYFKATLENRLGRNQVLQVYSTGDLTAQWAQHPEIHQKIYTLRTRQLTGGIAWRWFPGKHLEISPALFYTSATYKRTDLYNGNLQYFPQDILGFSQQFGLRMPGGSNCNLAFGGQRYSARRKLFSERQDWYYRQITAQEIDYYQTANATWWGELSLRLQSHSQRVGYVGRLRYAICEPAAEPINAKREQLTFNLSLEY